MSADTDLDLVFRNAAGKKVTLNIEEPKTGVTKAEIDAAMQVVVDNNIFNTSGGDIVDAVEGRLRLSWFLLVRMEDRLAGLTEVIGELSCNIAAMRGDVAKK